MLPKWRKLNLRQHPDFFRLAKRLYFPFFTIFYTSGVEFLITVVVPKKVSLKATKRNYLRRVVYEEIKAYIEDFQDKKIHIAIVLKPDSSKITPEELRKEIITAVRKVNFRKVN